MVTAAGDRPLIEMGSRRTHEEAAVAAARAAYLAGFSSTSNLEAGRRYGMPTAGTAAHAFTLLHDTEAAAFRAQVDALGDRHHAAGRHLRHRPRASGPRSRSPARTLGAVRIDSGDLAVLTREAREQLDSLGAHQHQDRAVRRPGRVRDRRRCPAPRSTSTGWAPSLVTGSGAPTAGMVYKLVEVDGRPVEKRVGDKATHGGRKSALRRHRATGTATEEVLVSRGRPELGPHDRLLQVPLMRGGKRLESDATDLGAAGARLADALRYRTVGGAEAVPGRAGPADRAAGRSPMSHDGHRRGRAERLHRGRLAGRPRRCRGRRGDHRPPPDQPYDHVVATRDHHIDPGTHFAAAAGLRARPGRRTAWSAPAGSSCTPELDRSLLEAVFDKGEYAAAYSGFEGRGPGGAGLADWLRSAGVDAVEVMGPTTDHCVVATALDAAREGFATTVLLDLTAGVARRHHRRRPRPARGRRHHPARHPGRRLTVTRGRATAARAGIQRPRAGRGRVRLLRLHRLVRVVRTQAEHELQRVQVGAALRLASLGRAASTTTPSPASRTSSAASARSRPRRSAPAAPRTTRRSAPAPARGHRRRPPRRRSGRSAGRPRSPAGSRPGSPAAARPPAAPRPGRRRW